MKIILASNSPRRKELLTRAGIDFEVIPADVEEIIFKDQTPFENVKHIAKKKCMEVFKSHQDRVVLAADTIVVYENEIFGKPKSTDDAYRMLKTLSGKAHYVATGICVASKKGIDVDVVKTEVVFSKLTDEEIYDYIATKEPMDKAGAYAIQGIGAKLVKSYSGEFNNIVGLPLDEVKKLLDKHM